MGLESLLLSRDSEVLQVLEPTLEKLAIGVEVCREANSFREILDAEKFDAVIVDCDDLQEGLDILQVLRSTPRNSNSVAFAILSGKHATMQDAFSKGANFVLQKPITPVNASRCFHAALSSMIRERRRYFRQPVETPVMVLVSSQEPLQAASTNVSEGGIAIKMQGEIPKGTTPRVRFTLPDTELAVDVECDVAWADGTGRVGLRFRDVPQSVQDSLNQWLNRQMEKEFPGDAQKLSPRGPKTAQ